MEKRYIIGIDQSTQGTKALLFDGEGHLLRRTDLPHRQIVNEKGWVSHDLNEIYRNTVQTVKTLVAESGVAPETIAGIGISNQRETTAIWDKATGEPLEEAIVWQCGRASGIAQEIAEQGHAEEIREATGLQLSAYFPAAKMAWLLRNGGEERQKRAADGELCLGTIDSWLVYKLTGDHAFKTDFSNASRTQLFNLKTLAATGLQLSAYFPAAKMAWLLRNGGEERQKRAADGELCLGTIDSWLVYKLTGDHAFKTDFSNASRTQLFNLKTLAWDEKICEMFGIPACALARVCDSDAVYGTTTLEGLFCEPVPICGVLGDSHAALFGQGCLKPGMIKATYGTGSSLMMNIGDKPIQSSHGVVTSLAWGRGGKADYVLEGNLNYTGAVITWLKDDLKLISSAKETEGLAREANPADRTYLVPAFTGLGAPYWDEKATASISGITRTTGKAEVVKAALDCIAYQITDLVRAMEQDTGMRIEELRVDGGPTRNGYLMQFQSDITNKRVNIPDAEELSGIGAAYMAGISAGVYDLEKLAGNMKRSVYEPKMDDEIREKKYAGWKVAVDGCGKRRLDGGRFLRLTVG